MLSNNKKMIIIILLSIIVIVLLAFVLKEEDVLIVNEEKEYGNSTLGKAGGLLLCMQEGIDTLLGEETDIQEYIDFSVNNGYKLVSYGTNYRMIEAFAETKGLGVRSIKRTDGEALKTALQSNNPVIMLCGNGNFTTTGKYILLTSIDEYDDITIYDPTNKDINGKQFSLYYIINNSSIVLRDKVSYWEIYVK